jgi:hypothetical protein
MTQYSIMNFTTLGLGDVLPKSVEARSLTVLQAMLSYCILLS